MSGSKFVSGRTFPAGTLAGFRTFPAQVATVGTQAKRTMKRDIRAPSPGRETAEMNKTKTLKKNMHQKGIQSQPKVTPK